MKRLKSLIAFALSVLFAFAFAACDSDSEVSVTEVTLNRSELTINIGESDTLTATVKPDNATDKNVTWTSDSEEKATVENGVVTAIAAGVAVITATADGKSAACTVTIPAPPGDYDGQASFKLIIGAYEFGPAVDKLILTLQHDVAAADVIAENFNIRSGANASTGRTITDAYISNADGAKQVSGTSKNIAFELRVTATANGGGQGSAFSYGFATGKNSWAANLSTYNVRTAADKSVKIGNKLYSGVIAASDKSAGRVSPLTDSLKKGKDKYENVSSQYGTQHLAWAGFEPAELKSDSKKQPLIIWLHGAGEGGTGYQGGADGSNMDIDIALLGNQVTNLFKPSIQNYFKTTGGATGAYVLAVQSPTMWMDSGSGQHSGDQDSVWTTQLKATIDKYIDITNTDIDKNRIYIGGCSNGGYMTMNMVIKYPEYFAAAFPVCEAYADSFISEEKLQELLKTPMWFTSSANDTTVVPSNFAVATYSRLLRAGAADVHFTYFGAVTSGEGFDISASGYMAHWSWIWTLQDRCVNDFNATTIQGVKNAADLNTAKALITVANCNAKVQVGSQDASIFAWLASHSLSA